MSLSALLAERARNHRPVGVGIVGVGQFGSMVLSQVHHARGLRAVAVVDVTAERARAALTAVGIDERDGTLATSDVEELMAHPDVEVVVEATGSPSAGIKHVLACIEHKKHVVMVNAEADALAGPLLARQAASAGIVYSYAYGDQPSIICDLVDWAETCGLRVVSAGKGTRYLPSFHTSTPETVWDHFTQFTAEQVASGRYNAQMTNSFVDGTKSAVEMTLVANATGLRPSASGLSFPPAGISDLASVCRPAEHGGTLDHSGIVEVVSSLDRDGRTLPDHLQFGVYAVVEAPSAYAARCFAEYGLPTDESGRFGAVHRSYHLNGLEVPVSIASAALRGEPTGGPVGHHADVVATAKRDLRIGETLDGEGGYTVWGRLAPVAQSLGEGALPMGLADGLRLVHDVPAGATVRWDDVAVDHSSQAIELRRELEREGGSA